MTRRAGYNESDVAAMDMKILPPQKRLGRANRTPPAGVTG